MRFSRKIKPETWKAGILRRIRAMEHHFVNLEDRYADLENRFNELRGRLDQFEDGMN